MKKRISIIFLLLIILLNTVVCASILNLDVKSNKDNVEVGEEVVITVDWKDGMQAADFILNFDSSKFEFVDIDIDDSFYKVEKNKVNIVWVSLDNVDKTSIEFTFKALKSGKSKFEVEIDGGFATGELELPDDYNIVNTTVKVNGITTGQIILFVVIAVVLILVIVFISKNLKARKK